MKKIKAIIKEPNEKVGHMTTIDTSLENLQQIVGGYIQILNGPSLFIICNEEGKLRGLPENFTLLRLIDKCSFYDVIRGTVIVTGVDKGDLADIPYDLEWWKRQLKVWGNTDVTDINVGKM